MKGEYYDTSYRTRHGWNDLSPDHSISIKNKEAIWEAQKNGIEVVIATGRSFLRGF